LSLEEAARSILDSNLYMTLGTADDEGRPWVSPVFYAADAYRDFFWISSPDTRHSQNLAARPDLSIVVFDSQQPPGTGAAVYMTAVGEELAGGEVARGLEVYPVEAANVEAPSPYRLYRARVSEHSMLCPRDAGRPCAEHRLAFDHRTTVAL
jgi:hypothetical protein